MKRRKDKEMFEKKRNKKILGEEKKRKEKQSKVKCSDEKVQLAEWVGMVRGKKEGREKKRKKIEKREKIGNIDRN